MTTKISCLMFFLPKQLLVTVNGSESVYKLILVLIPNTKYFANGKKKFFITNIKLIVLRKK